MKALIWIGFIILAILIPIVVVLLLPTGSTALRSTLSLLLIFADFSIAKALSKKWSEKHNA